MSIAKRIDGKAFATRLRERVATEIEHIKKRHNFTPGLAVVLVGEDPASQVYVRNKSQQTVEVGMASFEHRLDTQTSEGHLLTIINNLNANYREGRRYVF